MAIFRYRIAEVGIIDPFMNRLTRFSTAAFGMVLLAGLAYYQGHPPMTAGEEDSLVGTVLPESGDSPQIEETALEKSEEVECDPTKTPEDPDFDDCVQVSQK
jgi:hypothetical protein